MACCFTRERRDIGPKGTEKLLNPGDADYDAQMSTQWGGPAPKHYPQCWEDWPNMYAGHRGQIALVTGGTGGIGFYVAKMLAHLGYELILPVRTGFEDEAVGAFDSIKRAVPDARITVPEAKLDLESLTSVRAFAAALPQACKRIDLLCLNAGRGGSKGDPREETIDGIEAIVQVNAVSQLLLAILVLPLLRESTSARIVSQSSGARFCEAAGGLQESKVEKMASLNGNDSHVHSPYNAFHQYQISKACNVFFTLGMNARLKSMGITSVQALTCEPGLSCTGVNIQHNLGHSFLGCFDGWLSTKMLHNSLGHHAADGALPMVLASVDPEPDTTAFYHPQGGIAGAPVKFDPAVGDPAKNAIIDPANVEGSNWPKESAEVFWKQALQWIGPVPGFPN